MDSTATAVQRSGIVLAAVEAALFAGVAILHYGLALRIGPYTLATPTAIPIALLETAVALALVLAVALPGTGTVRAAHVLAAQVLTVVAVLAIQVAFIRGPAEAARDEVLYGTVLGLAIASIVLVAAPSHRPRVAHRAQ